MVVGRTEQKVHSYNCYIHNILQSFSQNANSL